MLHLPVEHTVIVLVAIEMLISIFVCFFYSTTDGGLGLSILPLATLLTGILLVIGVAILFIVVAAVRKRRDPVTRNICDDKDKHLGM